MNEVTLALPLCEALCGRCGHGWIHVTPLWDRGHVLARRGKSHVFVNDDVRNGLQEGVDFNPLLESLGFACKDACPNCGRADVSIPFPAKIHGKEAMRCFELTEEDFVKDNERWRLRDTTITRLLGLP